MEDATLAAVEVSADSTAARYSPSPTHWPADPGHATLAPVPRDARFVEQLGAVMRQLFPKLASRGATRRDSVVARQVYAFLAGARNVGELLQRARPRLQYPSALVQEVVLRDRRPVLIRPVLPQDASLQQAFVRAMSPATRLFRFHAVVAELPEDVLRYLTEVDHVHHVALLVETLDDAAPRQVGEARWVRRVDEPDCADFAIAIADDFQHSGLGHRLLDLLQQSATERGIRRLCGHVLRDNRRMLGWLESRGWVMGTDEFDPGVVSVEFTLRATAGAPRRERQGWFELRKAA